MRVPPLHRSMFGQVSLLTLVLLAAGIYLLAIQPLWDAYRINPPTVQQTAQQQVLDELRTYLREPDLRPPGLPPIGESRVLRAMAVANPGFRYYVRLGDAQFGTGPARYYRERRLGEIERMKRSLDDPNICIQFEKPVGEPGEDGYLSYTYCDQLKYYEFSGVSRAIGKSAYPTYEAWVWRYSGGFLIAMAGIFLVYASILGFNMVMIRRVARVARSFDPEDLSRRLPEKGLPNEVLPLVRVANAMIARLEEGQVRRRFFFSAVAHEMNTPLTVLRTRLELLDEGVVKDKLVADVRRLMDLVDRLLTLMRIDGHATVGEIVDLAESCHAVAADAAPLAAGRGVAIVVERANAPRRVVGDAKLIDVALSNLVHNALSFSPEGGTVVVTLDGDGRVTVRDEGPGIDEAKAAAMFEPFVRFSSGRPGHGLGLAIVRAVVTLHGGTVEASNAEGGGARFIAGFGKLVEEEAD